MSIKHGAKHEIVGGMVAGKRLADIAAAAGISPRTLRRRLKEPAVMAAIAEAQADAHRQVAARLTGLADTALTRIGLLLEADDSATQLRAARLVLERLTVHRSVLEESRLIALEAALVGKQVSSERPAVDGVWR
jgi:AcrR family transcriptional regulator